MTLCVIGTSHVGAIKRYVGDASALLAIDFYAGTASKFGRTAFEIDGSVVTPKSGLVQKMFQWTSARQSASIDLEAYDAFAFFGEPAPRLSRYIAVCGSDRDYDEDVHATALPQAQYDRWIESLCKRTTAFELVKAVREKVGRAAVYVLATPQCSRSQFEQNYPSLRAPSNARRAVDYADSVIDRTFAALGVIYVPQDRSTLDDDAFSLELYAGDHSHMNAAYGEVVIAQLMALPLASKALTIAAPGVEPVRATRESDRTRRRAGARYDRDKAT